MGCPTNGFSWALAHPQWHQALRKMVDAILHLQPPTNVKQLHSFLGMVNYYRDMWPRRTHVLAPLIVLRGDQSFIWTPECQQPFDQMKALVSSNALLAFPDHTQQFNVEMNASEYQLSSIIKQNGHPVTYYSRKLNSVQRNYMTIEKELLSIVETFKEFKLKYGQKYFLIFKLDHTKLNQFLERSFSFN